MAVVSEILNHCFGILESQEGISLVLKEAFVSIHESFESKLVPLMWISTVRWDIMKKFLSQKLILTGPSSSSCGRLKRDSCTLSLNFGPTNSSSTSICHNCAVPHFSLIFWRRRKGIIRFSGYSLLALNSRMVGTYFHWRRSNSSALLSPLLGHKSANKFLSAYKSIGKFRSVFSSRHNPCIKFPWRISSNITEQEEAVVLADSLWWYRRCRVTPIWIWGFMEANKLMHVVRSSLGLFEEVFEFCKKYIIATTNRLDRTCLEHWVEILQSNLVNICHFELWKRRWPVSDWVSLSCKLILLPEASHWNERCAIQNNNNLERVCDVRCNTINE